MPTSPTQDGTTPTSAETKLNTSVLGEAGQEPTPGTVSPGTVDQNTDAVRAAQAAEAAVPKPLTWADITLPEGLEVPEPVQTSLLEVFNDAALTPAERSAKLLALHAQTQTAFLDEQTQLWEQTQNEWREQTRALPEFQGGRYEQELGKVAKLLNRFGGSEVRKALDLTGAGNHPAVTQFFHKIASALMEDEPATGTTIVQDAPSRQQRLFGNNRNGG